MKMRIIAGVLFCASSSVALADMSIDLLRITCVPELRYFEIEAKSYSILAEAVAHGFESFAPEGINKRLRLLEQQGLYSPTNLKYTCKLPETTYELTATQPPASERGMCGASPTASFSLRANNEEWFRNVLLNEGCFDRPSVLSVTISDGKQGWTGRREMIVCLKDKSVGASKCHFRGLGLPPNAAFMKDFITQENLLKEFDK